MTFESAQRLFNSLYPGVLNGSAEGQAAFNKWSGETYGPGGFEGAPEPAVNNTAQNLFGDGPASTVTAGNVGGLTPAEIAKKAADYATANPNQGQISASGQTGAYNTTGTTNTAGTQAQSGTQSSVGSQVGTQYGNQSQQQTGTSASTTSGRTTGTSENFGTSQNLGTSQQQQQTQNVGTSTGLAKTGVDDTLGFGRLLQGQVGGAQAATDAQRGFLMDLVQNGPKNQQALTSQAVNNALSGPGMVGTGDGARARAAGIAGEQVGVNALNQQIAAAAQLAGPTATTTLAGAGNPYLGQTQATSGATSNVGNASTLGSTSNTGTTSNIGSTTGTNDSTTVGQTASNMLGQTSGGSSQTNQSLNLSNLLNNTTGTTNQSQAGTSTAQSAQAGIGNAPKDTTSQQGGCYACTAYADMGLIGHRSILAAAQWKLSQPKYRRSLIGYSVYGPTLAKLILHSPTFAFYFLPVARAVLHEELRLAGKTSKRRRWASLCHTIFDKGSLAIAVLTGAKRVKPCDRRVMSLLQRNNLLLEVV